jgi:hypothetical protein
MKNDPYFFRSAAIVIIIVCVIGMVIDLTNNTNKQETQTAIQYVDPLVRLKNLIESLPDNLMIKSNLSIVLGSEYCNSSEELNQILVAFAEHKLKELENKK